MKYRFIVFGLLILSMVLPGVSVGTAQTGPSIQAVYARQLKKDNNTQADEVKPMQNNETSCRKDLVVVTIIVLSIWFGIALLLFRIERKLVKLEKEIE